MSNGPNLLSQNLPIVKPYIGDSGLYPTNLYLSNLLWTKYGVQNVQKCPENIQNIQKKYRKVWIFLQNPGKRFEGFICTILGGFVLIFVIPA
jgi:hypothetical protein